MNDKHIFINCPFDSEYRHLLKSIIFTCLYVGLDPQLSDTQDSLDIRVKGIIDLIKSSKYSIHDLSRAKAIKVGEVTRMNMPFELGIDVGVREANNLYRNKRCIILESEAFLSKQALSDIAGGDHAAHGNDAQLLIRELRNWFVKILHPELNSATVIWKAYLDYSEDLFRMLSEKGHTFEEIDELPRTEYIFYTKKWIDKGNL